MRGPTWFLLPPPPSPSATCGRAQLIRSRCRPWWPTGREAQSWSLHAPVSPACTCRHFPTQARESKKNIVFVEQLMIAISTDTDLIKPTGRQSNAKDPHWKQFHNQYHYQIQRLLYLFVAVTESCMLDFWLHITPWSLLTLRRNNPNNFHMTSLKIVTDIGIGREKVGMVHP